MTDMTLSRAFLVAVVTIVGVTGIAVFGGHPPTKFVLQDGSTVELVKAEYGRTSHQMSFGSPIGKALCWVQSNLPSNGSAWLAGLAWRAGGMTRSASTASNALLVWLVHRPNGSTNQMAFRLLPVDKDGSEWGQILPLVLAVFLGKAPEDKAIPLAFTSFPRRSVRLRFRLYLITPTNLNWRAVGDFEIENPTYTRYPAGAEPTPSARVLFNGVEITLEHLQNKSGLPELGGISAQFSFRSNGVPARFWGVRSMELEDATGNVWQYSSTMSPIIPDTKVYVRGRAPTNQTLKVRAHIESYANPHGLLPVITSSGQVEFLARVRLP